VITSKGFEKSGITRKDVEVRAFFSSSKLS
jgi:hypothetical protein